jgi:nickel-dependent lactate racemase
MQSRFAGLLMSELGGMSPAIPPEEAVKKALLQPINSPSLAEMAKGKRNIVIVTSDHTRPVPSKILSPAILAEIRKVNPWANVTFLIATGCHRAPTHEELCYKFGERLIAQERIAVHDCDRSEMESLGKLPSGGELILNKIALEADLLLAEGFIEPHFFAGFSGGPKSILPGVASRKTVLYNHNAVFIGHSKARTGIIEGNPLHFDMQFAAKASNLAFICNVVLNAHQEILYVAAGDPQTAHKTGCEYLRTHCSVKSQKADIVITTNGGYPLDQNIYQAVKSMTAAEACVVPGGVIIAVSQCIDGHGGDDFYQTFAKSESPHQILSQIEATPVEHTIIDQWQSQIFARVLSKANVIFVSDAPDEMVKKFHMTPAKSLVQALKIADAMLNRQDGMILAIPDGVSVIVE